MSTLSFIIHNENGLDARLAGMLVKEIIACSGDVVIRSGGKQGNGKLIFNVLALHCQPGAAVELEITGGDEKADAQRIMKFAEETL